MTTNPRTEHLCPVIEHPELEYLDDAGITLWANAHKLTLHRDWRGLLCTTLADAWKLRDILDADNLRQAEAENARKAQLAAEDETLRAPLNRKLDAQRRRQEAQAQVNAMTDLPDERWRNWEQKADERGQAMFIKPEPRPEPDTRTLIERLKAKGK